MVEVALVVAASARLSIFRAEAAALFLITGLGPSAGPLGGSRST